MRKLIFALAIVTMTVPANAYEIRCWTTYYGNQTYSRCVPWYSEQELYQIRQNQALENLYRDTRSGQRRPSQAVCTAAIEAGLENGTLGCRD
jgi:hypothetical protein